MPAEKFNILLSRTDSIGDVVLTLPMAGFIKSNFPGSKVFFLGRTYTKDVVQLSEYVDGFINYDEILKLDETKQASSLKDLQLHYFVHVFPKKEIALLAKQAQIPFRVGTTNRLFHWFTCNKLIRLSRKKSDLHEAQLNFKLLSFLNVNVLVSLNEIKNYYGFTKAPALSPQNRFYIDETKINVILHPKSKGSAKEWGLDNFAKLISLLPKKKFKIFITGTKEDGELMKEFLSKVPEATDLTGAFSLSQLIAFINGCNALVAASTGPLHVAAALNKKSIGLFSPKRPIHPGRWMPLGANAQALVYDANCSNCARGKDCDCVTKINPQEIIDLLADETI